jgi:23S rRNA pseudouridine2604 synthase
MADDSRINKFIADSGFCSRRQADRLIEAGRVTLDDQVAAIGSRVLPGQTVRIDGEPLLLESDRVYLALYKPIAITCTTDPQRGDNIIKFLDYPKRIFPIGRLDRDSEGLILLTNDGSIVNKILRAGNRHEKEYRVTVDKPLTPGMLEQMADGVPILGTITLPCKITQEGPRTFRIILTQGLNRQIRRMCEYLGFTVMRLIRVRIMNITLGKMRPGEWRYLTAREIAEIRRLTQNSSQLPAEFPG